MTQNEEYQAKYGNSVQLSSDEIPNPEGKSVVRYTQIVNNKNGTQRRREMCACLDCQKTFTPKRDVELPWNTNTDCPECGGKEYGYDDKTVSVGRLNGVQYIIRPKTKTVYGNYDVTGTASRLNTVRQGELFLVYPSNKMHTTTCSLETSVNLTDGEIRYSAMNTENPDDPKLITSYQIADSLAVNREVTLSDVEYASRQAKHAEALKTDSYASIDAMPGVIRSRDVYDDDMVDLAYDEMAKRFGLTTVDSLPNVGTRFNMANNRITREQKLIDICIRYPGVRDMVLDKVNENLLYKKEPHTAADDSLMRTQALMDMANDLKAIDKNMNEDMRKLKSKEQVRYYLEAIAYGKKAMEGKHNPIPSGVASKLNVKPERSEHDGFGDPKRLKKRFNQNPVLTAGTIYTAIKITPQFCKKPDYANKIFDCIDADDKYYAEHPNIDRPSHPNGPNLIARGTLMPLQTRTELAFIKQYAKTHTSVSGKNGQNVSYMKTIEDWYGNNPETDRTNRASLFEDTASMYNDLKGTGIPIAYSRADCMKYTVLDAKRKIHGMMINDNMTQDDIVNVLSAEEYWGKSASACVGLIVDDLKKNGPPDPTDFGWVGRDGRSMMQNRTPNEIHQEFVEKTNSVSSGKNIPDVKYNWSKAEHERFDRDIDGIHFRLAQGTHDLIRTGQNMQICVGGSNYDTMCQNHRCIICIVENKAREQVGCIELSPSGDTLNQFKAPHNGAILDPYQDACKKWIEEAEIKQYEDCRDYEHMGDPEYFPYGNQDFTTRRLAANPYPDKNIILNYYREQEAIAQMNQREADGPVNEGPGGLGE